MHLLVGAAVRAHGQHIDDQLLEELDDLVRVRVRVRFRVRVRVRDLGLGLGLGLG